MFTTSLKPSLEAAIISCQTLTDSNMRIYNRKVRCVSVIGPVGTVVVENGAKVPYQEHMKTKSLITSPKWALMPALIINQDIQFFNPSFRFKLSFV